MQKKVLTEQSLFYGDVNMPKGFEINRNELAHYTLQTKLTEKEFPFSRTWDMLNTYVKEHINLKHKIKLVNKKTWGNIYYPLETTPPLINVNALDLQNSADYTLLYGLNVDDCIITIKYDDNRRKDNNWVIELKNNMFIMFPTTNMYYITNNQKDSLNFIQTITYEFI